jgi:hypothetical protein
MAFRFGLGLGLATWVARFGRAVALSVTAYVIVAAAPVFVLLALRGGGPGMEGLAMGSPWFGVGEMSFEISRVGQSLDHGGWAVAWAFLYTVAALLLYLTTQATFDRSLGRVTVRCQPGRRRA